MTRVIIDAICAGRATKIADDWSSGIAKLPLEGPVKIGFRGIAGDIQVDRDFHGFPAMALHQMPFEHHAWLAELFDHPQPLGQPGGLGENLSASGLAESQVFIGDRFRFGSSLIEITQPRQPCSTIEAHLKRKKVVKAMVKEARSGWFYRVLEEGEAMDGDSLELIERGDENWSVERAFRCVYGTAKGSDSELRELSALPRVSDRLALDIGRRIAS